MTDRASKRDIARRGAAEPAYRGADDAHERESENASAFMSAVVTEHFVLQSTASSTVFEAGTRAALYVSALASGLVAIGFASSSSAMLGPIVLAVLPTIFVLGWFTVVRLVEISIANLEALRAIARIRAYYRTLAPHGDVIFAPLNAAGDQTSEALARIAVRPGRLAPFFTIASMIAVVNSIVGGASVALVVQWWSGGTLGGLSIGAGIAATAGLVMAAYRFQQQRYVADAAQARRRDELNRA